MNARERLPDGRVSETFAFQSGGLPYVAKASRFPDGRVAEVFLTNHKAGLTADIMASDAAVHGVPLDTIRHALMRDGHGNALGPLGMALDVLAAAEGWP
jgi:hypothetical protein